MISTTKKFFHLPYIAFFFSLLMATPTFAGVNDECSKYYFGNNFSAAFEPCIKAAEAGNGAAQYMIGRMYSLGLGISQDHAKAKKWLQSAADNKITLAYVLLGHELFLQDNNDLAALDWYYKAENDSDVAPTARFFIGNIYLAGINIPVDENKAFQYIQKSADGGFNAAYSLLAKLYALGIGHPKDSEQALRYYRAAAQEGGESDKLSLALYLTKISASKVYGDKYALEARQLLESLATPHITLLKSNPKAACNMPCRTSVRYWGYALETGLAGKPEQNAATDIYKTIGLGTSDNERDQRTKDSWFEKIRFTRESIQLEPSLDSFKQAGLVNATRREYWPKLTTTSNLKGEFDISFVANLAAGMKSRQVDQAIQAAANVFAKCGVRLRRAIITEGYDDKNELFDRSEDELFDRAKEISMSEFYLPRSPHIQILWGKKNEALDFEGQASLRNEAEYGLIVRPIILNSAPHQSEFINGMTLAHELGHQLATMGHPYDFEKGIMQYYSLTEPEFTPFQCQRIREHPNIFHISSAKKPENIKIKNLNLQIRISDQITAEHLLESDDAVSQSKGVNMLKQLLLIDGDPHPAFSLGKYFAKRDNSKHLAVFYRLLASALEGGTLDYGIGFVDIAKSNNFPLDDVVKIYSLMRNWRVEDDWPTESWIKNAIGKMSSNDVKEFIPTERDYLAQCHRSKGQAFHQIEVLACLPLAQKGDIQAQKRLTNHK